MKVGILTQYYPPEMGAAQARLSELAARLVERRHDVVVLTAMPSYPQGKVFRGYGGLIRRERLDGIDVLRTWAWPSAATTFLPRMASYASFATLAALVGALRLPRLDVLLTESPPLTLGPTGYVLSRLKGARMVFNVSDLWPASAVALRMLPERGRATKLAFGLEAFCYRRAWAVSGQSREIRADIERRFPDVRTIELDGGVDTRLFDGARRDPDIRARYFGTRPVVALYAGLHGIAQGLEQVLDAAALLRSRDDVSFVLMGDGPLKAALRERARLARLDNVHFVDPQPRSSMAAILASADIAVVPLGVRLVGAVPSKLYEAMASALPVVLVADGEPRTIVEDAGAGLVVEPGDVAGIAAAIGRLASDAAARARMGAEGRRAAVERHDRRVVCDRFIDALETLA